MLIVDNNLLSDYLVGVEDAGAFLADREGHEWAVPAYVVYEAYLGVFHGGSDRLDAVRHGIRSDFEVLPVTERTAYLALRIQDELQNRGVTLDRADALIAASSREHGGTFATAEKQFFRDDVRDVLDVTPYRPSYL
jgi:predicted nucleic acid-binding protein